MKETIYDHDRRLKAVLDKISENRTISNNDKEHIYKFKDDCLAMGLSKARTSKYMYLIKRLRSWLDTDFENATHEDIRNLVIEIANSHYSEHTKQELKMCIRRLYKLIRNTNDYPSEVKWIVPKHVSLRRTKLPEQLLTEEDIKELIRAAKNPRNQAFVSVLYETGCRIGEILFIRIKHIQFDKYGAVVHVSGKKGSRRIRIVASVPYLTDWLNLHKSRDNPEACVWTGKTDAAICYPGVRKILSTLGKRANIKKKLNPHNFCHSRATCLANHLTEAQMKEYFGWVRSSQMAEVYVHLSGRDVDNAILKVNGISVSNEIDDSKLKPKICLRCDKENPATNNFCCRCGLPLDREAIMKLSQRDSDREEADRIMAEVIKDKEFRELLLRKTKEVRDS